MKVKLTKLLEKEIASHIEKLCSAYLATYNSNYQDVLAFLQVLSGLEPIHPASYKRFQPLIRIYNTPLKTIPFLEGLEIDVLSLQSIILSAIHNYLGRWLDTSYCAELSPKSAGKHYYQCKTIIDPSYRVTQQKSKLPTTAARLDVTVKRIRPGKKKKSYNLMGKRGQQYLAKAIEEHDVHKLLGIIDQLYHDGSTTAIAECEKLKATFNAILIKAEDFTKFPRCEFYSRYYGSTLFHMDKAKYWHTYHRSQNTRFFDTADKRAGTTYKNPYMQDVTGAHAASTHLGNVRTPASVDIYSQTLLQDQTLTAGSVNIRDHLLHYRLRIAKKVIHYFEKLTKNRQPIQVKVPKKRSATKTIFRPIIHTDNDYPCIVVHLPTTNLCVKKTITQRFWSQHKADFQYLAVCVFIAFVNTEAVKKRIPIEMVLRSSFGHNIPAASPTCESFRINTGLVPEAYAEVIATALVKTIINLDSMNDLNTSLVIDKAFEQQITAYNARKLRAEIEKSKYKIFDELKASDEFAHIEQADCYKKVRLAFDKIKIENSKIVGQRAAIHVDLVNGMSSWNAIRHKGNSGGNTLLYECFRRDNSAMDWFIDRMIESIELSKPGNPTDLALTQLIRQLNYSGDQVTIQPPLTFPSHKKFFKYASLQRFYRDDPRFFDIISKIIKGLGGKTIPNYGLYAEIEKFGVIFVVHSKTQADETIETGYGSDSDFEDEYHYHSKKYHITHKKVRVGNGMKAIVAGHHGALKFLQNNGICEYTQNTTNMYYEVEPALRMIKMSTKLKKLKLNPQGQLSLMYFDLNYNNSNNSHDREDLHGMLDRYQPIIIMLDITSATSERTLRYTKQCLSISSVKLVLLVESGLKHSQAGLDNNPYGEIRIISNNKATTNKVYKYIIDGLSKDDELRSKAHVIVKSFKRRGFARSMHNVFAANFRRHKAVEAFDPSLLTPTMDFSGL